MSEPCPECGVDPNELFAEIDRLKADARHLTVTIAAHIKLTFEGGQLEGVELLDWGIAQEPSGPVMRPKGAG